MSSSAYWSSEYSRIINNAPSSSNYYNQSFVDKINEAQASIDNLVAEKDKAWSASQQKMDEYDTFRGSMKAYGDVWKSSEDEFGVKQAQDNYESSKKALAMTQTTLEALPSSINAASNRVMTQSQREQAYNILADRVNRNMAMNERSVSAYEEAWKNARENQSARAEAEMAYQQSTLAEYGNMWTDATNKFNQLGENLISAKGYKSDWENQYRTWQNQQWQKDFVIWENELNAVHNRYMEALRNERAEAEANYTKAMSDIQAKQNYNNQQFAKNLVDIHFKEQNNKMIANAYDSGGALGKLMYVLSH